MAGRQAPLKPWERKVAAGSSTTPLGPSTANDGAPKPWEQPAQAGTVGASTSTAVSTPAPRPWERGAGAGGSALGQYGSSYGSPYSSSGLGGGLGGGYGGGAYGGYGGGGGAYSRPLGTYGSSYGGYGGSGYGGSGYGGSGFGGYGSSGFGGGYGSTYGSSYGSTYGGGMYGGMGGGMYGGGGYSPYGRPMGAMGPGQYDPNNPEAMPPAPPTGWQAMLRGIAGIVHFFGRLSFLVDENAHAVHFFISALLQLLDRAGSLYGELARFVLRLLGYKAKQQPGQLPPGPHQPPGQHVAQGQAPGALAQRPRPLPGLPGAPGAGAPAAGNWDSVWSDK